MGGSQSSSDAPCYARSKALPADLVEAQAKANSDCEKVWRVARANGDFGLVQPHLAEVLRLTREPPRPCPRRWA